MANNKKILLWGCLGCGGVLGLGVLLILGFVGFVGYHGYQFGKGMEDQAKQVALDYDLLNTSHPYDKDLSHPMTLARVEAFLAVRQGVLDYQAQYTERLAEKGQALEAQFEEEGITAKFRGFSQVKEFLVFAADIVAGITHNHIELLRAQEMSAVEYQALTRQYLGTLSHSADYDFPVGAALWAAYLEQFDKTAQNFHDENVQMTGPVRPEPMTRKKLDEYLESVEFLPENGEVVRKTLAQFQVTPSAPTVDFVALQLDRLLFQISR